MIPVAPSRTNLAPTQSECFKRNLIVATPSVTESLGYPHYSYAWAWTFDTPFKWTKQIPSFFGGTKNGMVISWPAGIKDKGGIRWQFHHVVDIAPTLLEITGIAAPNQVDGVAQKPIEGVSLAYTFASSAGGFSAPSRHSTQYFEMLGVQGL